MYLDASDGRQRRRLGNERAFPDTVLFYVFNPEHGATVWSSPVSFQRCAAQKSTAATGICDRVTGIATQRHSLHGLNPSSSTAFCFSARAAH